MILDANRGGSWIWKSLCELRTLARPFVFCEIGPGTSGSFWFDNWTSLGPLIELLSVNAPRITGLAETATVREALMGNQWWLSSLRSRNPIISFLRDSLPDPVDILNSEVDDRYLWQIGGNAPRDSFSSSALWNYLYNQSPPVPWYRSVWFAGMIPKHGFIMWLVALDRLSTRDRMRRWGVSVSPLCLFCGSSDECRQHIFFDCPYSGEVWSFFYSRLHLSPPPLFEEGLRWVRSPTQDNNINLILRLSFQASVYMIWKERNSRIHSQISRPPASLIAEIQRLIRAKLDSLSRAQRNLPSTISFLSTWFSFF